MTMESSISSTPALGSAENTGGIDTRTEALTIENSLAPSSCSCSVIIFALPFDVDATGDDGTSPASFLDLFRFTGSSDPSDGLSFRFFVFVGTVVWVNEFMVFRCVEMRVGSNFTADWARQARACSNNRIPNTSLDPHLPSPPPLATTPMVSSQRLLYAMGCVADVVCLVVLSTSDRPNCDRRCSDFGQSSRSGWSAGRTE